MGAGAYWRKEIRENEQAEISAGDQREEELRIFLSGLSTALTSMP